MWIIYFSVWKVGKFRRHLKRLHEPRVREVQIVDHMVAGRPGTPDDDLAAIGAQSPCKLLLWGFQVDVWTALAVIQEATAELMTPHVQIAIDVEVVLVKVAGRGGLKGANRN